MKLPRRNFCIWPRALLCSRPCRASRGRKPIRRGRSASWFLFPPVVRSTQSASMGGQDEALARARWSLKTSVAGAALAGAAAVARARPDGYTFLLGGTFPHINEALLKTRPLYDPIKDLEPIVSVAATFFGIAVHPSVPAQTLKDLIAYAKANPGKLSYGTPVSVRPNHLTGELFKSLAGTPDIVQVPYRGAGPAMTDPISGQLPMVMVAITGQALEFHPIR